MKTRYDLAIENAREAIEELRLAAYEQGYKDATHDLTAKSPVSFAEKYTGVRLREYQRIEAERLKSPQAQRDEIVEKAKRDVAELSTTEILSTVPTIKGGKMSFYPERVDADYVPTDEVEFVINYDKRTVVALIKWLGRTDVWAKGIAKCAPDDCFNVHIGKAIALRRALGLEVPAEYLNAPQPTEVRVGDIVGYPFDPNDDDRELIVKVDDERIYYKNDIFDFIECLFTEDDGPLYDLRIIDDSREEAID